MRITIVTLDQLDIIVPIFDGYRRFYKQVSDLHAAHAFLKERLQNRDSIIFLAIDHNEKALGFTQLYPSFSSVSMQRTYILNDLFVTPEARKQGVGEALMEHAKQFAIKAGSKGLTLETDIDNPAQKLYQKLGWKKDDHVNHYTWEV